MANQSPLTITRVDTADAGAPGAPGLTATQISNKLIEALITVPTTDADGTDLTGLKKFVVGIARAKSDGTTVFTDVANFPNVSEKTLEILAVDGVFAPASLRVLLPVIELNKAHDVAIYAED